MKKPRIRLTEEAVENLENEVYVAMSFVPKLRESDEGLAIRIAISSAIALAMEMMQNWEPEDLYQHHLTLRQKEVGGSQ